MAERDSLVRKFLLQPTEFVEFKIQEAGWEGEWDKREVREREIINPAWSSCLAPCNCCLLLTSVDLCKDFIQINI